MVQAIDNDIVPIFFSYFTLVFRNSNMKFISESEFQFGSDSLLHCFPAILFVADGVSNFV